MTPSIPIAAAAWRRRTHARSLGDGLYRLVAGKPGIKLAIAHQPAAPELRHDAEERPASPVGQTSLSPTEPAPDATNCAEGAGPFLGAQG